MSVNESASLIDDCDISLHLIDFDKAVTWLTQAQEIDNDYFSKQLAELKFELAESIEFAPQVLQHNSDIESLHLFIRRVGEPATETDLDRSAKKDSTQFEFVALLKLSNDTRLNAELLRQEIGTFFSVVERKRKISYLAPEEVVVVDLNPRFAVIGNSESWVSDVASAAALPNGELPRNLLVNRKFQRALADVPLRNFSVFAYYDPGVLQPFIQFNLPSNSLKYGDLSCGSLFAWFGKDGSLTGLGSVVPTFPGTGVPEIWDAFEPIQVLPAIKYEPIEYSVLSWDPIRMYRLYADMYERSEGQGSFDAYRKEIREKNRGLDPYWIFQKCGHSYSLRYLNEYGFPSMMSFQYLQESPFTFEERKQEILGTTRKHKGFGEREKFRGATVFGFDSKEIESQKREFLEDLSSGNAAEKKNYAEYYEDQFKEFIKDKDFMTDEEAYESFVEFTANSTFKDEGYLLSEDWYFSGHVPDLKEQYAYLLDNGTQGNESFGDYLENAVQETEGTSRPYHATFNTRPPNTLQLLNVMFSTEFPNLRTLELEISKKTEDGMDSEALTSSEKQLLSSYLIIKAINDIEKHIGNRFTAFFKNDSLKYYFKIE